MISRIAPVLFVLAAGCGRGPAAERVVATPDGWRRQVIEDARLDIAIPANAMRNTGSEPYRQWWFMSTAPNVMIRIWSGPQVDPMRLGAGPRPGEPGATFREVRARVCGRGAQRFETVVPGGGVDGIPPELRGPDYRPPTPAFYQVAVRFRHLDQDMVITWEASPFSRDSMRALEEHFFSTIRCL